MTVVMGPGFDAVQTLDDRSRPSAGADEPTTVRGFALYVGASEAGARRAGVELDEVVAALRRRLLRLVPSADAYSSIVIAPAGASTDDLQVVRRALNVPADRPSDPDAGRPGVVVDLSRSGAAIDGAPAEFTYREFQLLRALVLRPGRPVSREELIDEVWAGEHGGEPLARTVDVTVRRVRDKLGRYRDIIRTVRGLGYRFDAHADVVIRQASAPSPDRV